MADAGSVANLAAPKEVAATQDKVEEKDTRRAFNYALVKVSILENVNILTISFVI